MAVDKVVYQTVSKNEKINETAPIYKPPKGLGVRHLQALLLFTTLAIGLAMRSQLSVVMVAMINVNHTDYNMVHKNNSHITARDNHEMQYNKGVYRSYDWNKSTQEIIMFAFFAGYTSMQIPMGLIAQKVGGKIPLMIALGVNGVLSIIMPWIPLIGGWLGVSVFRFLQGMTQAAFYPGIHTMLAKWSPLCERGRLSTYIYSGSQIGTILAFQISGWFAGTPALGWPASFWMFGTLSLIVCGLLGCLCAASPHVHSSISAEEIMYITQNGHTDVIPKKRKTPWREIVKCRAVWGIVCSQAGSSIGYVLVLTEMPLYMSGVLGVDIKRNGLFSSLPYIAMCIMVLTFGFLVDYATNRNLMKVVNIRRTANTIGMVASAVFLVAFSLVKNTPLAVCLLVLSLALHSGVHVGFHINHIDLAPNFAGSIMALGNMLGHLTSLLVPVIVSNIVTDVRNHGQWQIVFISIAATQCLANTIYVIFAKGEVQSWNFYGEEKTENINELYMTKGLMKSDRKNGFCNNVDNKL